MIVEKTQQAVKNAIKRKLMSKNPSLHGSNLNVLTERFSKMYLTLSQKDVNELLVVTKDTKDRDIESAHHFLKWLFEGGLDAELSGEANSSNASA